MGSIYLNDSVSGWFQYFFSANEDVGIHYWSFCLIYLSLLSTKTKRGFQGSVNPWNIVSNLFLVFLAIDAVCCWVGEIYSYFAFYYLLSLFSGKVKRVCVFLLSSEILTRLGNISGKLYIIHYVVLSYIYLVLYRFGKETTSPVVVAIITFLITLLGTIIYSKVEIVLVKPFEKLKTCHRK